jgi:hypothetical protein
MADAPDLETACRDAIRHWSSLQDLAEFASESHGYGDSDGGFGVTYPGDLDEYAREVEGQFIPPGYLTVYGFWGLPDGYEVLVPEKFYLSVLAKVLAEQGLSQESQQVQALADQR